MTAPALPPQLLNFWANLASGTRGDINTIPDAGSSPLCSLADGIPLIQMTPLGAGGVPANGADMNGILQLMSKHILFTESGGLFPFQAALSAAWGGYKAGSVLISNDGTAAYVSLVNNNTTDFNTTPSSIGTLWGAWGGGAATIGTYSVDQGSAANVYVVAATPVPAAYKNGMRFSFKAVHTNTGASTLNAGPSAATLVNKDGSALYAGSIQAGQVYSAVYDAATSSFWLEDFANGYYEEGAWTPNITGLTFHSGAYGDCTSAGRYIRIGNVYLWAFHFGTSHGEPPSFSCTYPNVTITNVPGGAAGGGRMNAVYGIQWSSDLSAGGAPAASAFIFDTLTAFTHLMSFVQNHGGALYVFGITLNTPVY